MAVVEGDVGAVAAVLQRQLRGKAVPRPVAFKQAELAAVLLLLAGLLCQWSLKSAPLWAPKSAPL